VNRCCSGAREAGRQSRGLGSSGDGSYSTAPLFNPQVVVRSGSLTGNEDSRLPTAAGNPCAGQHVFPRGTGEWHGNVGRGLPPGLSNTEYMYYVFTYAYMYQYVFSIQCIPNQGSSFWLQNTEGLTLVGVLMEGTTLTC
jgi:hypothetical protein